MRRWEELRPELDARGIEIVTISTDHPGEIRKGRGKHGLKATMLSDRELVATDRFGLRNRGFHSGMPGVSAPALPIPTTVLVDSEGIVRWIDQSEDYQVRSHPGRVLGVIQANLA